MLIGTVSIDGPILAPMAGVTDLAFRTICAQMGAGLTVTEMVSSRALVYQDRKSQGLLKKTPTGPMAVQLFGNDPEVMSKAAAIAYERSGCDILDINMGCPVPKVAGNGDGSALMLDPDRAASIVEAIKKTVPIPVTVKTRIGWDRGNINILSFSKTLESAGADALAIHGRTKTMQYSGLADWDIIGKARRNLCIPVIANGDVFGPKEALSCRARTGCDLLMIGRASFGNPWVFQQVAAALKGETVPELPPLKKRMETAAEQFALSVEDKGEHIACLESRKYLSWYLHGVAYSGYYKEKISKIMTAEDVAAVIHGIQKDLR